MTLEKWGITGPRIKPRPATKADLLPLFNTFQRVRKLTTLTGRYTNVALKWGWDFPKSPDEWALVVEVAETKAGFKVTAVALGTIDKAKAVRRAYGWGLRYKDGDVNWPYGPDVPAPEEPHFPDVDEAARFGYWRI